jgi:hypothetical protein
MNVLLGGRHLAPPVDVGNVPDGGQLVTPSAAYVVASTPALTSQKSPSSVGAPASAIMSAWIADSVGPAAGSMSLRR